MSKPSTPAPASADQNGDSATRQTAQTTETPASLLSAVGNGAPNMAGFTLNRDMVPFFPYQLQNPMLQPPQNSLENAIVHSLGTLAAQSSMFGQLCEKMLKAQEEARADQRSIREEHRAEREKADERSQQNMDKMMALVHSLVERVDRSHASSYDVVGQKNPSSSSLKPAKRVKSAVVRQSNLAKRTGAPVDAAKELKKIRDEENRNHGRSAERDNVFIGAVLVGKGSQYDKDLEKFKSFRCRTCNEVSQTKEQLVDHFSNNHAGELGARRSLRIKQTSC